MKRGTIFALNTLGWLMIFVALIMGAVYTVGSDDHLYYDLQMRENIPAYAGIGSDDLLLLDERLSDYLFKPMNADVSFDNRAIEVYGEMSPPFNEKELTHLHDCRKLLSPAAQPVNYVILLGVGFMLVLCGKQGRGAPAWIASAVILAPIAILGVWAALDFNSAFHFFHKILFTNDLWLLDPRTDLLIRICPASMFAHMGLRIALMSVAVLVGIPAAVTVLHHLSRKRKSNETQL